MCLGDNVIAVVLNESKDIEGLELIVEGRGVVGHISNEEELDFFYKIRRSDLSATILNLANSNTANLAFKQIIAL